MAELEVSMADGEYYFDVANCPFCGQDKGEFDTDLRSNNVHVWVECLNWDCGARGPVEISYKQATDSWNKRT